MTSYLLVVIIATDYGLISAVKVPGKLLLILYFSLIYAKANVTGYLVRTLEI